MAIPIDTSVEAEYQDGYVHSETELGDVSAFADGKNIFYDVLHGLPEPEHGSLVRFSCFYQDQRYDVDWTELPDNARPIRFRHGYSTMSVDGSVLETGFSGVDFGYQWNDDDGLNHQEVINL